MYKIHSEWDSGYMQKISATQHFLMLSILQIIVVTTVAVGAYTYGRASTQQDSPQIPVIPIEQMPVACTMEAKICPDGSAVGRSGPKCEFAPCPTTQVSSKQSEFINKKYGYSFQYEPNDAGSGPKQTLTDDRVSITGMDSTILQIEPIMSGETNPMSWWKLQNIEPYHNKPANCFTATKKDEIKSFYEPEKTLLSLPINSLALELNTTPQCSDPSDHIVIVEHKGTLLKIMYDDAVESEKIISTFKFL